MGTQVSQKFNWSTTSIARASTTDHLHNHIRQNICECIFSTLWQLETEI